MAEARETAYRQRIDELREHMIEDLKALVRCPSTAGSAGEGAPFGVGPAEALREMLSIGEREGMRSVSVDGMAGYIEYGPETGEIFGILSHLDVVPEGNGWTYSAFEPVLEDDLLYGRGTSDDKGPAIAAFYALKALADCGFSFKKRVRMIYGLDEETGEASIDYYKAHEEIPSFSIVPDSDFPVVRCEKGIMTFDLVRRFRDKQSEEPELLRIAGGAAANMVPDRAEAEVRTAEQPETFRHRMDQFAEEHGFAMSCEETSQGTMKVTACGKSAHGSMPWKGQNAISILMAFLNTLEWSAAETKEMLAFYNSSIGFDLHGAQMGIPFEDEESGRLVINAGLIRMDSSEFRLTINARMPVTCAPEEIENGLKPLLAKYGLSFEQTMYQPPLHYTEQDPRIVQLMEIYRRNTGDQESSPLIIGGGTYARQFDNAVAFGALYPGDEDRMHGADEYISIDRLVQTAKIYADTIFEFAVK